MLSSLNLHAHAQFWLCNGNMSRERRTKGKRKDSLHKYKTVFFAFWLIRIICTERCLGLELKLNKLVSCYRTWQGDKDIAQVTAASPLNLQLLWVSLESCSGSSWTFCFRHHPRNNCKVQEHCLIWLYNFLFCSWWKALASLLFVNSKITKLFWHQVLLTIQCHSVDILIQFIRMWVVCSLPD